MINKITKFCTSYLSPDSSILVAVSGGCDSIALIYLLHNLRNELKIRTLAIAHVNHGLRGDESDNEERFVREIAHKLDLQFFLKRLNQRSLSDPGIEAWARQERYRFFQSVRESGNFNYVATGHTADDQAETILFRMLRGAGHKGMRGILPRREDRVIRPLLFVRKLELTQWLETQAIPFKLDSSNADIALSRNYIRHEVLPAIIKYEPDAVERMAEFALQMQKSWNIIEAEVNMWVERFVVKNSGRSFVLKKDGLANRELAAEGLRAVMGQFGVTVTKLHIENLFLNGIRTAGTFLLPGKWRYHPTKEKILFILDGAGSEELFCVIPVPGKIDCKEMNISFKVTEESVPEQITDGDNWSVYLDRDCICGDSLFYRKVKDDDIFHPLGRNTSTSLSQFLAKQGLSKAIRQSTAVVADAHNNVVWIPGIRISHCCAVTKSTNRVLKIASGVLS